MKGGVFMAVEHEIARDILLAFMDKHNLETIEQVADVYKSIYNVVHASTDPTLNKGGFPKSDKQD